VELPTDIAIRAVEYQAAVKENVKYIIEATTFRAEGIIPHGWGYKDAKYVKSIQKQFGTQKLNTFPNLTLWDYFYYNFIKKLKLVRMLNYIDYQKSEAKKILKSELDWQDYGEHHHESVYTRFFQAYLAPKKFNMDRKKVTLSAMIRSNEMSRDAALNKLGKDYYNDKSLLEEMEYISKKFEIPLDEFKKIVDQQPKSFFDYPSYYPVMKRLNVLINLAHRLNLLHGGFQKGRLSVSKK